MAERKKKKKGFVSMTRVCPLKLKLDERREEKMKMTFVDGGKSKKESKGNLTF